MDMDAALKDGYTLEEVNAEAARRTGFKYDAALADGYSQEDINAELRKRLAKSAEPAAPTKASETQALGNNLLSKFKKVMMGDPTPDESMRDSPLVAKIPGGVAQTTLPPISHGVLPTIVGTADAALAQGASLAGSIPAAIAMPIAAATYPLHGTSPATVFEKIMESAYQPKTASGKEQNDWMNENVSRHLMAAFPMMHDVGTKGFAKKYTNEARSVVEKTYREAETERKVAAQAEAIKAQRAEAEQAAREAAAHEAQAAAATRPLQPLDAELSAAGLMPERGIDPAAQQAFQFKQAEMGPEAPANPLSSVFAPDGEAQGGSPLPFVPELSTGEAPQLVGKLGKFEEVMTEAQRTEADRAAALKDPIPFERMSVDPLLQDFVPQEAGLPFSREGKLSTPVEVAHLAKDVRQGLRDVESTAAEIQGMRQEAAGKTTVGPEHDMAIQGMEHDLANAQGRTTAAVENATQVGRDLGQLKIDTGAGPRPPGFRFGNKQRGAIDPSVFLKGFPEFAKSIVRDPLGKLQEVYHGSTKAITGRFNTSNKGFNIDKEFGPYAGDLGSWFSSTPKGTDTFAGARTGAKGGNVNPVYLNIQNPAIFKTHKEFADFFHKAGGLDPNSLEYKNSANKIKRVLIKSGYDGIKIEESRTDAGGLRTDWVAFHPEQIESSLSPSRPVLGQTAAGKGQRGSIGFFSDKNKTPKESFEDFAKSLRDVLPDVTPEELQAAWKKQVGQETLAREETKNMALYGNPLKDTKPTDRVEVSKYDPAKVLDDLVNAPDSLMDENWFEKNFMSSGYMRAIVQNNPAVSQAIRYLKGIKDRNANRAENALFRANNRPGVESGLIHDLTSGEKLTNVREMADLTKQWFAAKNNPDHVFNFTPLQERINAKKEAMFGKMLSEVNQFLPEKRQIKELPNYIPSVHSGKFYFEVSKLKEDGTHTKPVMWGLDNRVSGESVRKYIRDQGYNVSEMKTRETTRNDLGSTAENRAANYQYMLEILTDADPEVVAIGKALSAEQQGRATTTSGVHHRFETYKGYKGELGNNPFKSDKQNYYDAKRMLIDVVESHYDWLSAQEGAAFGKQITEAGNKIGGNNRFIVGRYIDDSIIGRRFSNGIENTILSTIEGITGASDAQTRRYVGQAGNILTAMMTSMGSPIHALQNVVQPLTVIIPQMLEMGLHPVDMTHMLTKGVAEYAAVFLKKQVHEVAKLFGDERVDSISLGKAIRDKQEYAERVGIISPTIVDTKPMFNNKYANRTHQFGTQGFLSKPTEQAARFTVFSAMADFYVKRGMSKEQAFNKAREVTETYMVDYGSDAKANVWKDAGFIGNLAGRLQTFATNNLSQTYAYGKAAKNGGINNKLAFASYLGVLTALGGVAGMPFYDAFEAIINSLKSKDGKQFSLRNEIRGGVGNFAINGVWEAFGLGAAPSFSTRSINTDGPVPLPAMVGVPAFSKVPEIARTVKRRLDPANDWANEPEAEKGRQALSIAPVSVRNYIEDAWLKEDVNGRTHNISPMTGNALHTATGPENSSGNIRSAPRADSASLANESYKGETRFKEQKKDLQHDLDMQIRDIYQYGNGNAQKQLNMIKNYRKFVVNYAADPNEIEKVLNNVRPYVTDEYVANIARIAQKANPTLEDVRQLNKSLEYRKLKAGGR